MIYLRIAGFDLQLEVSDCGVPIALPVCHEKFHQPVLKLQAGFLTDNPSAQTVSGNILYLRLQHGKLPGKFSPGTPLVCSTDWQLWQDTAGNLTFVSPSEPPPSQVTVDPGFSRGEVLVDLSFLSGSSFYPLANLESRLFSAWLASSGDFIMHASGVSFDGKGYCFLGDSGAGKSTLAAILAKSQAVTVLGEDQVILRYLGGQFWIFGTPWHLNPAMCSPLGAPLEKIFFLDRHADPGVKSLKPVEGVTRTLRTAIIPYHLSKFMPLVLDRLVLLADRVPFYQLSYQLGADPWPLILNA